MNNTNAPLALRADAPAVFGSRDEIKAIADRIAVMLPSARLTDTQLGKENRNVLERKLNESVYRAAQLCVFYRLVPGEDVHVIPFGDSWAVDMGIETWKKAADRYCSLHGVTYHIHTEEMTERELIERRGADYDPADTGVVAYLWRSDKKDVYEIFGAKSSMSRATGIWAKKAKYNKWEKTWQEDNTPAQRTKQDVAKRRAMKAVLKLEFSLDSLLAATPAEVRQSIQFLERDIRHEEEYRAVPNTRRTEVDENGLIVVEPTPRPTVHDVEFVVAEDDMPEPDADEIVIEQSQGDATNGGVDYAALAKKLSGTAASFASWAKSTHLKSNGPASVDQYRFLVGILNGITGDKQCYRDLLGVMVGRYVNSEDRPGMLMASKLLEWLRADYVDEVTGEKIANPQYRADYADAIRDMWQMIKGAA